MRPNRRLASVALAATAGLALAACSSTVDPTFDAAPMTQKVAVAADTGAAPHTPPRTPTHTQPPATPSTAPSSADDSSADDTSSDDTSADNTGATDDTGYSSGSEDLPEPGYGVYGDEGLCQAVAGWYGYAGLALVGASADGGHVFPDDIVPILEQLRDAPTAHEDADPDLVDAASDLSFATDDVITEITSGADAAQAMGELDDPATTFLDGCIAAGVSV